MKQKTSADNFSPKPASLQQQKPGDEAPQGTPGTGEDICPDCNGRGRLDCWRGTRRCAWGRCQGRDLGRGEGRDRHADRSPEVADGPERVLAICRARRDEHRRRTAAAGRDQLRLEHGPR